MTDIPEGLQEGESILTVPNTPEESLVKHGYTKPDENAPWYWREGEEGPPQPRTPEEALQRRYSAGIARTIEDLQDQSPRPKRIKTPPQDSDESSGGVGGDKEKFTVPEIVKRYKSEKDQSSERSSHSWTKPRINMIRFSSKEEQGEEEERLPPQPRTPEPLETEGLTSIGQQK